MNLTLKVWRQESPEVEGRIETYEAKSIPSTASFLEMLDIINEELITAGKDPIAFDHDCREGICGQCSLMINGVAHGPERTTSCQLHMRSFTDGETIYIEPFRARSFPVVKDLVVDRGAFERIQQAGGYISVRTGSAPEANSVPVPKHAADDAFEAAACISCGACVAACKNASAMLFVGARISSLNLLPQGQPEKDRRTIAMVEQMDAEGFGNCTNYYECEAVCPKSIPADVITRMNRDYLKAKARESVMA